MSKSYVSREHEQRIVRKSLRDMQNGLSVEKPIIEWHGIPGTGKTTLTEKILADLCLQENIPYARIDFDTNKNPKANGAYTKTPGLILADLIEHLNRCEYPGINFQLPISEYINATDDYLRKERERKMLHHFSRYMADLIDHAPVVFAFDTTEKVNDKLVNWIEKNIIRPLILQGKFITIWTGRFKQQWHIYEVGSRVRSTKLNPFSREATSEQSQLYGQNLNGIDIYSITFGHPLANKVLCQLLAENPQADRKNLINEVNNTVIDRWIMDNVDDDLNHACRFLSVVRQFDFTMTKQILSKFADPFKRQQHIFPMQTVSRLTSTSLVKWNSERKGYALDETIRHILALHLRTNNPQEYLGVNMLAANIYKNWIERVPENRSIYILEWIYHQVSIGIFQNMPPDKLIKKLENRLNDYLQEYYHYDDRDMTLTAINKLYKELENDKELYSLLGNHKLLVFLKDNLYRFSNT